MSRLGVEVKIQSRVTREPENDRSGLKKSGGRYCWICNWAMPGFLLEEVCCLICGLLITDSPRFANVARPLPITVTEL